MWQSCSAIGRLVAADGGLGGLWLARRINFTPCGLGSLLFRDLSMIAMRRGRLGWPGRSRWRCGMGSAGCGVWTR